MKTEEDDEQGMLLQLPSELLLLIFDYVRGRHLVRHVRLVCRKFHCLLTNQQWWLTRIHLPSELLLLIFDYVRGRHLVRHVRLVCRKFHCLLTNQQWWLTRIHKLSSHQIRLSDCETKVDDFDAARSFVAIEEEVLRFTATGHIATVDALRLFPHRSSGNRFCLSGGRDRAIKLWNISELEQSQQTSTSTKPCYDMQNAHEGWIWCLDQSASKPEEFLSCSWDCTVKLWQITPTQIAVSLVL
ncbi:F-box domain protein [Cooperia oncophora]